MTQPLILNVDDYDANRYVRSGVLRRAGFEVIEASGGREALELAEQRLPDLVVLDVQLPDIDGFEVCRRLRQNPRTHSLLVLHVSAVASDDSSMVEGLENGADAYLTDSVDPSVMLATVKALLRLRTAEQERNAALDRLRRNEEELRRANRLKDEFLATLSHELRTPMNAIVGWAHLLRQGSLSPQMARRAVDAVARNADAQMQLINDVLDVSRIVSGKMRLELHPLDVVPALQSAVEAVRPAAEAKQIALEINAEATLMVKADADRLQQVFWNLLSNAVKFTPAGGSVVVDAREAPGVAIVEVRDNGIGIPRWFLAHLFERFSQVDSSIQRQHAGLGLGLALVRHLVELHGGRVEAASEGEGHGATFTVTLPLADRRETSAGTAPEAGERRPDPLP